MHEQLNEWNPADQKHGGQVYGALIFRTPQLSAGLQTSVWMRVSAGLGREGARTLEKRKIRGCHEISVTQRKKGLKVPFSEGRREGSLKGDLFTRY